MDITTTVRADSDGRLIVEADPDIVYVVRYRPNGLVLLAPVRATAAALLDNPDAVASIARGLDQLDRGGRGPRSGKAAARVEPGQAVT